MYTKPDRARLNLALYEDSSQQPLNLDGDLRIPSGSTSSNETRKSDAEIPERNSEEPSEDESSNGESDFEEDSQPSNNMFDLLNEDD